MRYLLIGNYGVGNLGDEALKDYFLQAFPEVEWVVVSELTEQCVILRSPTGDGSRRFCFAKSLTMTPVGRLEGRCSVVPRLPFGLRSLFLTPWWRTLEAYWHCDGVVFGGGSLFTDIESVRAPILWWWHALVAWIFRKPIFLAFQGVGPLRTRLGTYVTRWVIRHARFVSVRDHVSLEGVRKWRKDVVESFDPIFKVVQEFSLPLGGRARERGSKKTLVLIPRSNSDKAFFRRARDLYTQKTCDHVRILSLQPSDSQERITCAALQKIFPNCTHVRVRGYMDLVGEICQASFVLSQRYHGALAALALGIPFEVVVQAEGDKLSTLVNISKEEALGLIEQGEKALCYALKL